MTRTTLLIFCVLLFSSISLGQSTSNSAPPKFALFIVEGFSTKVEARGIDTYMRSIPGVQMSRMDIPTHRYYIIFDHNAGFDQSWFEDKFEELGNYTIHCYIDGEKGTTPFEPITRDNCSELNQ